MKITAEQEKRYKEGELTLKEFLEFVPDDMEFFVNGGFHTCNKAYMLESFEETLKVKSYGKIGNDSFLWLK